MENQLYNDKTFAEQDEHPWLGRILFRDGNQFTTCYRCTVVLLNPRRGLAPALCVDGRTKDPYSSVFGRTIRGAPLHPDAILAGVRLVNGEPIQYYIIRQLLAKFDSVFSGADLFMYIAPYINWIEARINVLNERHISLKTYI